MTVTLSAAPLCSPGAFPLHVALVLDSSASMKGQRAAGLKTAAGGFVTGLDLALNPLRQVGVVEFNHRARTLTQLTNSESRALAAIAKVGASGGTSISSGLREVLLVLLRGRRSGIPGGDDISRVMVLVSDGGDNAGCEAALRIAEQAKGQGVLVHAVCLGPGCDAQCLRQVASGPPRFHQAADSTELVAAFAAIRTDIVAATLRRLDVTVVLPDEMRYVEDSAVPPARWNNKDTLKWRWDYVAPSGIDVTFALMPREPGYLDTFVSGTGEFVDSLAAEGTFAFRPRRVLVLRANPVAPSL